MIYNINDEEKIIQIFYIGRRKDIYEQFRKLLTGSLSSERGILNFKPISSGRVIGLES